MISRNMQFILLAALALLVIHLLAFAVISPLNVENADYWYYPYQAKRISEQGDWTYLYAGRQFAMAGLAISHILLPDRVESMYYTHVLFIYITALGLFYIFQRLLPRYKVFAFLLAAVYLLYTPFNNAIILHWLNPYTWAGMLAMVAAVCMLEASMIRGWRRWALLLVGGVLVYVASRAYESGLPLVMVAPALLLAMHRKINRDVILIAAVWWVFSGVGLLQFAVPYVRGDEQAWYQSNVRSADQTTSLDQYLSDGTTFMTYAFPLDRVIFKTPLNYRAPAVALAGIVLASVWLLRSRFPEGSELPPPEYLLFFALCGLAITVLGGLAFVYASLEQNPYSTYFGAPGQALVVLSVLALIAWAAGRLLNIRAMPVLLGLLAIYFVVATHWHYQAQILRTTFGTPFDRRIAYFQELASFAPQLEPDTLILHYNCIDIETAEDFRLDYGDSALGARFLYGYIDGSHTVMGALLRQAYDETGAVYDPRFPFDFPTIPARHYNYDQMVLVECTDEGLLMMDRFPPEIAREYAAVSTYNPYSRIQAAFIPADNARILAP
jgi:hypothetical protein